MPVHRVGDEAMDLHSNGYRLYIRNVRWGCEFSLLLGRSRHLTRVNPERNTEWHLRLGGLRFLDREVPYLIPVGILLQVLGSFYYLLQTAQHRRLL